MHASGALQPAAQALLLLPFVAQRPVTLASSALHPPRHVLGAWHDALVQVQYKASIGLNALKDLRCSALQRGPWTGESCARAGVWRLAAGWVRTRCALSSLLGRS